MPVTVRYCAASGRVQPYLPVWLVLDREPQGLEPRPPALLGFVRCDTDTVRSVATSRGDRHDIRVGFTDRSGAAEWLLIAGVSGFRPAPAPEPGVAARDQP
jgi:hypothetical protein